MTKGSIALAKRFGLEEYTNYKIENGKIYTIIEDDFGRKSWLFFAHKIAYRGELAKMYADIAREIANS